MFRWLFWCYVLSGTIFVVLMFLWWLMVYILRHAYWWLGCAYIDGCKFNLSFVLVGFYFDVLLGCYACVGVFTLLFGVVWVVFACNDVVASLWVCVWLLFVFDGFGVACGNALLFRLIVLSGWSFMRVLLIMLFDL